MTTNADIRPAVLTTENPEPALPFLVADFGDRKLVRFECSDCHETFELCFRDDEPHRCLDCRADLSRELEGWTPENSLS